MNARCVKQRNLRVLLVYEERYLCTTQDDCLRTLGRKPGDDSSIHRARLWNDLAQTQLIVNDLMNEFTVFQLRY